MELKNRMFENISEADLDKMIHCFGATTHSYRPGDTVCDLSGQFGKVGILLSGAVEVIRIDSMGNRTVMEVIDDTGIFGEMIAFSSTVGDSIYIVCTREAEVMYVRNDQVTKRCKNACRCHSILVENMLRLITDKAVRMGERIEVLSNRTIREKLNCCFKLMAIHAGSTEFDLPFTMTALAEYICADRSAMMREVKKMTGEHLIQINRRHVRLLQGVDDLVEK
ncbi:MAG: Crp/Fnr family transcriptional regulator [Clostridia bacterium]|nr:Crp/Fnr family transcriptional regulator [Clostridia bacterium]